MIGVDKLLQDVLTWQKFYISGRLQKPVRDIVKELQNNEILSLDVWPMIVFAFNDLLL